MAIVKRWCLLSENNCSLSEHPTYSCQCKEGFGGNGNNCQDQNECEVTDHWLDVGGHNCSENGACNNIAGGFQCTCNQGYSGDGVTCTDINECAAGTACNEATEDCTNTEGSFTCTCKAGFSGSPCTDINECDLGSCDQNASCNNTEGSFECSCNTGFSGDGFNCQDINECLNSPCSSLGWLMCFSYQGFYSL